MKDGITYDMFFLFQSIVGATDMILGYLLIRNIMTYSYIGLMIFHGVVCSAAIVLLVAWLLGDTYMRWLKIKINLVSAENVITYMHPIFVLFAFNAFLLGVTIDLFLQVTNNTWNNSYALMLFAVGAMTIGSARLPPRMPKEKSESDIVHSENTVKLVNRSENITAYNYTGYGTSVSIPIGDDGKIAFPTGMQQRTVTEKVNTNGFIL